MALLGTRNITAGDIRRYAVNYADFLTAAGATGHISGFTVAIATPGVTSTFKSASLSQSDTRLYFYIQGGSAIGEQFTVSIQITDTQGETVNDTVQFTVVAP